MQRARQRSVLKRNKSYTAGHCVALEKYFKAARFGPGSEVALRCMVFRDDSFRCWSAAAVISFRNNGTASVEGREERRRRCRERDARDVEEVGNGGGVSPILSRLGFCGSMVSSHSGESEAESRFPGRTRIRFTHAVIIHWWQSF